MIIKTTIAAALLGLSMNAFAAVDGESNFYRFSDINSVTQGADYAGTELKSGRIDGFYKWSDRNQVQGAVPSSLKPVGKTAESFYSWSDLNSVTR